MRSRNQFIWFEQSDLKSDNQGSLVQKRDIYERTKLQFSIKKLANVALFAGASVFLSLPVLAQSPTPNNGTNNNISPTPSTQPLNNDASPTGNQPLNNNTSTPSNQQLNREGSSTGTQQVESNTTTTTTEERVNTNSTTTENQQPTNNNQNTGTSQRAEQGVEALW